MKTLTSKNTRSQAAVLICLLVSAACMHNPGAGGATTALQKTIIANAAVVKVVSAVEQGVEDAVTGKVLTPDRARPVILGCQRVMQASIAITSITSKGTEATWNVDGPKIRALLAATPLQISQSTNAAIDLLVETANSTVALLVAGVK